MVTSAKQSRLISLIGTFSVMLVVIGFAIGGCSSANVGNFMERFLWRERVVLVFAPTSDHADLIRQKDAFNAAAVKDGLKERDIRVITLIDRDGVWIDEANVPRLFPVPFYKHFKVDDGAFSVILVGKDGGEKMRSAVVVTPELLFSLIDAMPMGEAKPHAR